MRFNKYIAGLLLLCFVCLAAYAATGQYFAWIRVGGTKDSPNFYVDETGHVVALGGVDTVGGKTFGPHKYYNGDNQTGLYTGGDSADTSNYIVKGTIKAANVADWDAPAGMEAALSVEDRFDLGAVPVVSLIDGDGKIVAIYNDGGEAFINTYSEDVDTVVHVLNSDGTRKASLEVEKEVAAESLDITKGGVVNNLEIKDWSGSSAWAEIRHDDNDNVYLQMNTDGYMNLASDAGEAITLLPGNDAGHFLELLDGRATFYGLEARFSDSFVLTPHAVTRSLVTYPIDVSTGCFFKVDADAGGGIANPTGSPSDGQEITIRVRQPGTGYTIVWDTAYKGSPTAPSTTPNAVSIYRFSYDATDSEWLRLSETVGIV